MALACYVYQDGCAVNSKAFNPEEELPRQGLISWHLTPRNGYAKPGPKIS